MGLEFRVRSSEAEVFEFAVQSLRTTDTDTDTVSELAWTERSIHIPLAKSLFVYREVANVGLSAVKPFRSPLALFRV